MQNLNKIPGWDGYEISEDGKVWSFKRMNPVLKVSKRDKDGYTRVGLSKPGRTVIYVIGEGLCLSCRLAKSRGVGE